MASAGDPDNPNLHDLPHDYQQVMSAQVAQPAPPVNGQRVSVTQQGYGTMESAAPSAREVSVTQSCGAVGNAVPVTQVSTSEVVETQESLEQTDALQQAWSGTETFQSPMTPGANAVQPPSSGVLFSPSQLQRLEELRSQAPLLYPSQQPAAGLQPPPGRAQVEAQQPVTPQSSASCSAEAIQAEVRRQLASMNQAHELRIRELEEENRRLRQGSEAPMVSRLGGVLSGFLSGLGLAPAPQRASTQDPFNLAPCLQGNNTLSPPPPPPPLLQHTTVSAYGAVEQHSPKPATHQQLQSAVFLQGCHTGLSAPIAPAPPQSRRNNQRSTAKGFWFVWLCRGRA